MKTTQEKLALLQCKMERKDSPISIMILGLGSVGNYLLDYLVSLADPRLHVIVVGRNEAKLRQDVNIVRTAATIRRQMRCTIDVDGSCDLNDIDSLVVVLNRWRPDFIVNSSRVYSGLKYGSISWSNFRAYGIWAPLSIRYARNIMLAYEEVGCDAISINTSYSDAVIPWLKTAGKVPFDFGSGNLNHLIPRMKFYLAQENNIENYNDIDITMAVSHFHDVVISKEGHSEGQDVFIDVKYQGKQLPFDKVAMLKACMISMPVDQKRNMMNASSNFDIIYSIIKAIDSRCKIKIHCPGIDGEIGGYPYIIDAMGDIVTSYFDTSVFSMAEMRATNRESIYKDGIENVVDGSLIYTDELVSKVKKKFNVDLPKQVHFDEIENVGELLVKDIIEPNVR